VGKRVQVSGLVQGGVNYGIGDEVEGEERRKRQSYLMYGKEYGKVYGEVGVQGGKSSGAGEERRVARVRKQQYQQHGDPLKSAFR
jgi:hypothetical protein